MDMDINRIKVVLVEKKQTNKWGQLIYTREKQKVETDQIENRGSYW